MTQKLDQCSAQLGGALAIPHPWSFALDCHQVLGLFCNGRPPKEKPQAKPPKGDKTYSANSNFRSHTRTGCTTKSSTTSRRESHASNRAKSGTLIKGERSPKSRASAPVCLPQNYCGSPTPSPAHARIETLVPPGLTTRLDWRNQEPLQTHRRWHRHHLHQFASKPRQAI